MTDRSLEGPIEVIQSMNGKINPVQISNNRYDNEVSMERVSEYQKITINLKMERKIKLQLHHLDLPKFKQTTSTRQKGQLSPKRRLGNTSSTRS